MKDDSFKAMGILWSSSNEYFKDIMLELSKEHIIEQIVLYNLRNKYADFILGCYQHDEDVMSDGYIDEKIERLLQDSNTTIVAFTMKVVNPQYRLDAKGRQQCIQARSLKERTRERYSKRIQNYFLDNIIHIADNEYESIILERLFNRYQKYAINGYLRKGCKPKYAKSLYEEVNH